MKKFFIMCLTITFSFLLNAQNAISGKITDESNTPLAGATIFAFDLNKGTISDANGFYELGNLPEGKLKIEYSFIGYASEIRTLTLALNDSMHVVNIILTPSVIEGEEIVITGGYNSTQHENAVKIDILKLRTDEIKSTPNFMEVLTKIPGVDMISKGSGISKPVIRGLSMNDILVLNNGVRYENYQYSSHHPLGIDEFGIADVEIIKGPASLLYGSDAIGGVLNFIKEKPAPERSITGDYNLQVFSNTLGMTNNFGIKGASEHLFGGVRAGQKTNADFLQGGGEYAPNSRFNEYSLKTNAGYTGKLGTFKLFYDYSRQNLGLVEDEAIEEISSRGRKCGLFYQQLNTHLVSTQSKLYLGKMKLDINSAYQNTELIHFGDPGVYEIQMRLATITYEAKLYFPSDENSEYILGIQGLNQFNTNINDRETILLPDAVTNNYSIFGLLQKTFFSKLKLQAGLRYDYKILESEAIGSPDSINYRNAMDKNYDSFSGSIGSIFQVTKNFFFRANIAAAYRTPNLAELTSNGPHETIYELGDNTLVPENSYEFDASIHYHQDNFLFDIAGFYNIIDNHIYIAPTGDTSTSGLPVYRYMQQSSELFGGEAGIHFHPRFIRGLHLLTTFSSVIGKQDNGEYLPFIPAHKWYNEIRIEKENLWFLQHAFISVNSQTAFRQDNTAPDETSTAGYTLVDLSAGSSFIFGNQVILIVLGANNIFDKKYTDHLSTLKEVGLYNPGRNIFCSLKLSF